MLQPYGVKTSLKSALALRAFYNVDEYQAFDWETNFKHNMESGSFYFVTGKTLVKNQVGFLHGFEKATPSDLEKSCSLCTYTVIRNALFT